MIDKMDKTLTPTKDDLINIVAGEPNIILKELCTYIEGEYKVKPQVDYSTCSAAPGWNFKLKKGGKSICTVYPEKDMFIMLVTLNWEAQEIFNSLSEDFIPYIRDIVKTAGSMNNTKWLMIEVRNEQTAADVKKLLEIKFGKR